MASENVVAGLNMGIVNTPGKHAQNDSLQSFPSEADPSEYSSTLNNSDPRMDAKLASWNMELCTVGDSRGEVDDDGDHDDDDNDDDDFGLMLKADRVTMKSRNSVSQHDAKSKQSTPAQVYQRSASKTCSADHPRQGDRSSSMRSESNESQSLNKLFPSSRQNRSIITRNSSILDSMREARSILNKENGSAQSKASAIDILANAMSKANVEAKTGQRILESVSSRSTQDRAGPSHVRKDYQDMPKVNKVLQKLASNKDSKKVSLDSVKTPLKQLVNKAAEKKDASGVNTEVMAERDSIYRETSASNPTDLSTLLTVPVGMRAATGILGNFLQQNGTCSGPTSLFSTVFSSNITAVKTTSEIKSKPTLSRSWSSGDIKHLNKESINNIGPLPTRLDTEGVSRMRSNSIGTEGVSSLASVPKSSFNGLGMLKRSNSSGSFSDLIKQVETKPAIDSSPKAAPFISFDNYGVEDFSFEFGSSVSTVPSASVATTTTSASNNVTTSTVVSGSKPTGFLRGLFLNSSDRGNTAEVKRPSSVYENDSSSTFATLGKGSSSSAESGMNRFGKALAQDDFGGFGFGFMSYFGGSKS